MASNVRKKQEEENNLKTLREIVALPHNKHCFDCNQRGPTYVNMMIGSFVCTACSGLLRGLNPPHRVKSISMASFSNDEMEFIKSRGNEFCRKVWLGLYDGRIPMDVDTKDEGRMKDLMCQRYEKKRWYVHPTDSLFEECRRMNTVGRQQQQTSHNAKPLSSLVAGLPHVSNYNPVISSQNQQQHSTATNRPSSEPVNPSLPTTSPVANKTLATSQQQQQQQQKQPQQQQKQQQQMKQPTDIFGDFNSDPFGQAVTGATTSQQQQFNFPNSEGFADFAAFESAPKLNQSSFNQTSQWSQQQQHMFNLSSNILQPSNKQQQQQQQQQPTLPTTTSAATTATASFFPSTSDKYSALAGLDGDSLASGIASIDWNGTQKSEWMSHHHHHHPHHATHHHHQHPSSSIASSSSMMPMINPSLSSSASNFPILPPSYNSLGLGMGGGAAMANPFGQQQQLQQQQQQHLSNLNKPMPANMQPNPFGTGAVVGGSVAPNNVSLYYHTTASPGLYSLQQQATPSLFPLALPQQQQPTNIPFPQPNSYMGVVANGGAQIPAWGMGQPTTILPQQHSNMTAWSSPPTHNPFMSTGTGISGGMLTGTGGGISGGGAGVGTGIGGGGAGFGVKSQSNGIVGASNPNNPFL